MAKRERMSSVDTSWLRMDRANNLMMIVGVLIFADHLSFERVRETVAARLLRYRRFKQRAVIDTAGAYWEDDEDFDLDAHVRRVALPGHGGKPELQGMVADLVSQPLDPYKPLWQFQLVERYDGGSALIVRIHHCIADGIALVGVMLSLTDESAEQASAAPEPNAETDDQADQSGSLWDQLWQPLAGAVSLAREWSGSLIAKGMSLVRSPEQALDYVKIAAAVAIEIEHLATMPNDTPTRLKGRPGATKRVAWSEPLPLTEVKAVGKAVGCSLNDILLACVAGALRAYLIDQGDDVANAELRALVPVNLRAPGLEHELGNRFGLVALVLPVGVDNPFARLYKVKRQMEELKDSYQAAVTLGLLSLVGMAPRAVQEQILDMLARKATAVMTNVPGPQRPIFLAGARLAQQMFWVPQSGDIGVGVSILSYNGGVQFGLVTDKKLVPDPQNIVARFVPEFEKILLTLLMEPWDRRRDPSAIEEEMVAAAENKPQPKARPGAKPAPAGVKPRRGAAAVSEPKPRRSAPRRTVTSRSPVSPAPTPAAAAAPRIPKRFR